MQPVDRVALALDVANLGDARRWTERMNGEVGVFKVGLELFVAEGQAAIECIGPRRCFLDLKLHDIPATMAKAATVAAKTGVRYLTVHAAAGRAALEAVREAVDSVPHCPTEILAVTVLTSLDTPALEELGLPPPTSTVQRWGQLAIAAGCHGLVCSPLECASLREALGPQPTLMVPGIRPATTISADDQKRVATPAAAIRAGASVLVIGRPIRNASDPIAAARSIADEIKTAITSHRGSGDGQ